jgi:hypothetical protein
LYEPLNGHRTPTYNQAAWEALLAQHWFEEESLRNEYFVFLSYSGKLEPQLKALRETTPKQRNTDWQGFVRSNPAAGQFLAQADLWRSHYEESAPILKALAAQYPAASELDRTVSSVYRSLAYFDPANTDVAVQIEKISWQRILGTGKFWRALATSILTAKCLRRQRRDGSAFHICAWGIQRISGSSNDFLGLFRL